MWHLPTILAAADSFIESTWIGLDEGQRFVVLLVVIGCGTGLVLGLTGIIAGVYAAMQNSRNQMELKQDMLDRGMSADEISEVIKAAPVDDAASRWVEGWFNKKKGKG